MGGPILKRLLLLGSLLCSSKSCKFEKFSVNLWFLVNFRSPMFHVKSVDIGYWAAVTNLFLENGRSDFHTVFWFLYRFRSCWGNNSVPWIRTPNNPEWEMSGQMQHQTLNISELGAKPLGENGYGLRCTTYFLSAQFQSLLLNRSVWNLAIAARLLSQHNAPSSIVKNWGIPRPISNNFFYLFRIESLFF